jgi:SAM-dependent methyltransferase
MSSPDAGTASRVDDEWTPPPGETGSSPVPPDDSAYWTFYDEVAAAQLAAWLPASPQRVLDVSGPASPFTATLVRSGHEVLHVTTSGAPPLEAAAPGSLLQVVADAGSLDWLTDGSVDAVLAESGALSLRLTAEQALVEFRRVLRPGGRLLLVVESLVLGLARLADQGRWAELADVPAADVVLVPVEDGSLVRCFWPEELHALLTDSGLDVEWVRPRSVISPNTVERAVAQGGAAALRTLVATEVALAAEREGESTGLHLVASARRP